MKGMVDATNGGEPAQRPMAIACCGRLQRQNGRCG
jgi:hypothetical protein